MLLLALLACSSDDPPADSPAPDACALEVSVDGTTLAASGCGAELDLLGRVDGEGVTLSFEVDGAVVTPVLQAGPSGGTVRAVVAEGSWGLDGDAVL
jgi:hypothetical protein